MEETRIEKYFQASLYKYLFEISESSQHLECSVCVHVLGGGGGAAKAPLGKYVNQIEKEEGAHHSSRDSFGYF